jgi:DNA-binding response OmpR family regulator
MKRILIVDDEPHVIRILKLSLSKAGYDVADAANGLQAIDSISQTPPDVLITDIDMPLMNGKELCMHIEKTLPERDFIIYVLTSRADNEHRIWTSTIANLEFLEKPVSIRKLVADLNHYFSKLQHKEEDTCPTAQSRI